MARPTQSRDGWGSRLLPGGGARFGLWAPGQTAMSVRLDGTDVAMDAFGDGWFSVDVANVAAGTEYMFVRPDGMAVPDPASRLQAGDVHGPSVLVDADAYHWQATDWAGRPWNEAVLYELHIGTFTPEGTFRAAIDRLDHLADLGITAVEIMPVAQFAGTRGWGYDGVLLYAPHNAYGGPDDLKALVDAAHRRGMMVLLDVVYNHFGPDGNYLGAYAPDFFHPERHTPWGPAIAYEKPPVRDFMIGNALYWLTEFRFDGLRLDAIDNIRDEDSEVELLVEMAERIRSEIPDRPVHLTTEDNRNVTHLHERGEDGSVPHYTAEWNDDFHNAAHAAATGETDAYYADFAKDHWQKLARSLAEGFAFQGEVTRDGGARGAPSGHLPPTAFVDFLQNHDQVGNRAFGERLIELTDTATVRALAAILMLSPHVPMLFMGEEWGERRPFTFFTDFHGELAEAVRKGRRKEFAAFAAFRDEASRAAIPDPNAPSTFEAAKIDWQRPESEDGRAWLDYCRTLLGIRHAEIVPHLEATRGHCGSIVAAENGRIAVDWQLAGARLGLRANLSAEAAPMAAADGRVIFATHDVEPGPLPAHSVTVWIADTGSTP